MKLLMNKGQGWLFMQNNQSYGNLDNDELCIKTHFKKSFFNNIQGGQDEKYSIDFNNSSVLKMVKGISKSIEKIYVEIVQDERLEQNECIFQILVQCGKEGNLTYQRQVDNDEEINMRQEDYFEDLYQQQNPGSNLTIQTGFLKAIKELQFQILEFSFYKSHISIKPGNDQTEKTIQIETEYLNNYQCDIIQDGINKAIFIPENYLVPQTHVALKMKTDLKVTLDTQGQQLQSRNVGVFCSSEMDQIKMVSFFKSIIQDLDSETQPEFQQRIINQTTQMNLYNQQYSSLNNSNYNHNNFQNDQSTHIQQQQQQQMQQIQDQSEQEDDYDNKFKSNYVTDEENIQSHNNTQVRPQQIAQNEINNGKQFIQPLNKLQINNYNNNNNGYQTITNSNKIVDIDEQVNQLNKNSVTKGGLNQINLAKQQKQQLNYQIQPQKRAAPFNNEEKFGNSEEQRRKKQIKVSSNSNYGNQNNLIQEKLLNQPQISKHAQPNYNQTNQSSTSSLNFYSESNNNGYQSGSEYKQQKLVKNQNFIQSDKFASKGISSIEKQEQSNFLNNTSMHRQSEFQNLNQNISTNQITFRKPQNSNINNLQPAQQNNLLNFMNEANKNKFDQNQNTSIFQSNAKGIQMATQNSMNNSAIQNNLNTSKNKFKF